MYDGDFITAEIGNVLHFGIGREFERLSLEGLMDISRDDAAHEETRKLADAIHCRGSGIETVEQVTILTPCESYSFPAQLCGV